MALRNPTTGPRVVPFGEARKSTDVLANGRPAFRVTQRFSDTDRFFGGKHGAIDLGNFGCGDRMLASHSGYVLNRRDIYGALICEISESSTGNVVGYGHLASFARAHGTYVTRGTIIGYVGDTGLGAVCHCHYYYRLGNGVLVDPWPLLEQNATTPKKYVTVAQGARIRAKAHGSSALIQTLGQATRLARAGSIVEGGLYTYEVNGKLVGGNKWLPVTYNGIKRFVILPFAKAA